MSWAGPPGRVRDRARPHSPTTRDYPAVKGHNFHVHPQASGRTEIGSQWLLRACPALLLSRRARALVPTSCGPWHWHLQLGGWIRSEGELSLHMRSDLHPQRRVRNHTALSCQAAPPPPHPAPPTCMPRPSHKRPLVAAGEAQAVGPGAGFPGCLEEGGGGSPWGVHMRVHEFVCVCGWGGGCRP